MYDRLDLMIIDCNGVEICDGNGNCISTGDPCSALPACNNLCDEASKSCLKNPNGSPCSDGLFCNGADQCNNGNCSVHAGTPCISQCANTCNEATDRCTFSAAGQLCDDGV
jgi:hypothetical protein